MNRRSLIYRLAMAAALGEAEEVLPTLRDLSSDEVEGVTGKYYANCNEKRSNKESTIWTPPADCGSSARR
jgi:hypothetical protein